MSTRPRLLRGVQRDGRLILDHIAVVIEDRQPEARDLVELLVLRRRDLDRSERRALKRSQLLRAVNGVFREPLEPRLMLACVLRLFC